MAVRAADRLLGMQLHKNPLTGADVCSAIGACKHFSTVSPPKAAAKQAARDSASTTSTDHHVRKGRSTLEMATEAAERFASQAPIDTKMAERVEGRARSGGFVPAGDASPSVESAGRFGGPGTAAMADFVDMVAGAFVGEKGRVQKAVEDLSHGQAGVPRTTKPPSTTSQAWPKASLQPADAQPDTDEAILEYCRMNRARGGQI